MGGQIGCGGEGKIASLTGIREEMVIKYNQGWYTNVVNSVA